MEFLGKEREAKRCPWSGVPETARQRGVHACLGQGTQARETEGGQGEACFGGESGAVGWLDEVTCRLCGEQLGEKGR